MPNRYVLTSESVTEGHPDKIADQIADAILDEVMKHDPYGRVACEVLCTAGVVIIAGEITSECYVDIQKVTRQTIKEIGYDKPEYGFDHESCAVLVSIHEQSPDIAIGVLERNGHEEGAGDQGMMIGYATNETPEYIPLPIVLAHKLTKKLSEVRKKKILNYLGPDGKSQLSVAYEDNIAKRIEAIVVSSQHSANVPYEKIKQDIIRHVITPVCGKLMDSKTKIFVNPTGRFVKGGPAADTGVTGRKIMVDTYGGLIPHGGGCFSGKDPTKVDRSGAYAARYIAKNIVAAGLADKCQVQIAYAIGVAEPVSLFVTTFGTGKLDDKQLMEIVRKVFSLKPKDIIEYLHLRKPIYKKSACYGAFGRHEPEFTWERTDKVEELRRFLK